MSNSGTPTEPHSPIMPRQTTHMIPDATPTKEEASIRASITSKMRIPSTKTEELPSPEPEYLKNVILKFIEAKDKRVFFNDSS